MWKTMWVQPATLLPPISLVEYSDWLTPIKGGHAVTRLAKTPTRQMKRSERGEIDDQQRDRTRPWDHHAVSSLSHFLRPQPVQTWTTTHLLFFHKGTRLAGAERTLSDESNVFLATQL
jgi:hypothetical protein